MKLASRWVWQILQWLLQRHRASCVQAIQPGNCEWVTAIECINASGSPPLPPMIIFAGKFHQSQWYQDIDPDWVIGTKLGWMDQ